MEIPLEIELTRADDKGRMCWIDPQTNKKTVIERAVAGYFRACGWRVPYADGNNINCSDYETVFAAFLLSMMFDRYDHKDPAHREIFEDLLSGSGPRLEAAQVGLRNPATGGWVQRSRVDEHEVRFASAASFTKQQIEANLKVAWKHFVQRKKVGREYFGEQMTPSKMLPLIMLLYDTLGIKQFLRCQRYKVEAKLNKIPPGWPDLAIWIKQMAE